MTRYLFVGERRSGRAIRMGVTWIDGRLAAASLFQALDHCGVDRDACEFVNLFEPGGPRKVVDAVTAGVEIVGMGKIVQRELDRMHVPHRPLIHPAARGKIRRRALYALHVRQVLELGLDGTPHRLLVQAMGELHRVVETLDCGGEQSRAFFSEITAIRRALSCVRRAAQSVKRKEAA